MEKTDVIVIGAGWSGLLACKYCLDENLTVRVLEKRDDLGGIWYYSDDPALTTVMKTTETTSSNTVTEMADFPMPDEIGEFPQHADVLAYLKAYVIRFGLAPHLLFDASVTTVKKALVQDETHSEWRVTTEDGRTFRARFIIVTTGLHQERNDEMRHSLFKDMPLVHHSGELKALLPDHQHKTILLVGGGETASDIAYQLMATGHARRLYWSIPHGQHFFRKQGVWLRENHPLRQRFPWLGRFMQSQAWDKPVATRAMKLATNFHRSKPGIRWACKWTTNGSVLAYEGHGFPEWKSQAPFFHQFINKSAEPLDFVDYDRIVPKPQTSGCSGQRVSFADGTHANVEAVILCTGYGANFRFLPPEIGQRPLHERYKAVWELDDPTVAFIGFVRPIIGSIPTLAELQSRWVARVWSGRVALPPVEERRRVVADDQEFWATYFGATSRRISTLVEPFHYGDSIAALADSAPNWRALFRRSPKKWLEAVTAPYNGCQFLLGDPALDEQNFQTLRRRRPHGVFRSLSTTIMAVLLRLLHVDSMLDWLADRRYRRQLAEQPQRAPTKLSVSGSVELTGGD